MTLTQPSMFRTPEGQARYFAAYGATLALWPVPVVSMDLSTRFGSTHVNACGPEDAPPLLLLPGQAVSSTMWHPNVAALSQDYRLYALDIIGDMGKSVRACASMSAADYGTWLGDVLDGLRLDRAHVAGLSFGGFLALKLALTWPQRVGKLVLLSPAGLLRLRPLYILRMTAVFLPSFLVSFESKQRLLGTNSPQARPVIEQMMTPTDFVYKMFMPPLYRDEELAQVQAPTLLLVGGQEAVYDPRALQTRAIQCVPHLETHLIPDGGHALNLDQPDKVNQHILAFLEGEPPGA